MQTVHAPRASTILYHFLKSRPVERSWLLPANICPIVPITFFKAGIPFRFVDISETSFHMDLAQVEKLIGTHEFGGMLYAHTYGDAYTPYEMFDRAKAVDEGFLVVDDRCLCIPRLEPEPTSKADVTLYSTGRAKVVDLNYGGYAFIQEGDYQSVQLPYNPHALEEIEKSYKECVNAGTRFQYQDGNWLATEGPLSNWEGYRRQVEQTMKASLDHRAMINAIYFRCLPEEMQLPAAYQTWRFNIRVRNQQKVLDAIFASELFASSHYPSLTGIMGEGEAPQAEKLASAVVNLFNDHNFDPSMAEKVCNVILENL